MSILDQALIADLRVIGSLHYGNRIVDMQLVVLSRLLILSVLLKIVVYCHRGAAIFQRLYRARQVI